MAGDGSNLSVLLVEDNPADARFVAELLKESPTTAVDLTHASRLEEALQRLRTDGSNVVLLDLSLPDSQGLTTFRRTRAGAPDAPIVVLTGLLDEEVASRAVREGAQDYLVKGSVDGAQLHRAIRYAVDRHAVEAALRASEGRYRTLIESSLQGILIHIEGVVQLANRATSDLLGLDHPDDLLGASLWPFVCDDDRPRLMAYALSRAAGDAAPSHYEFRVVRPDGRTVWLDCLATAVTWNGLTASLNALVDITERKLAEENLRASEERYRQLADNIKEALIVVDVPGFKPSMLSRAWSAIWHRDPEEALRRPELWIEAIEPADRPAVLEGQHQIEAGEPVITIFRVHQPEGHIRWVRARLFPVRDDQGTVFRAVGLIEDITEVRETEELLRQAQRMEAVGRLAGGIAHDFNNIITAVLGYAYLALEQLGANHPVADSIVQIRTAGQSAASLTRQLLAFSRRQILDPQTIDLNDVVRRLEPLLRRVIGDDIKLQITLTPAAALVDADAGQIDRVVMNLAANARDAMPDGGRLTIETSLVDIDEQYAAEHPDATPGPHVMLAVSDNGSGMDEKTRRHLFDPFFTTKDVGRGTGLGLSTVYGIVKQSGGIIWVYSEPGHGSTFKIYLRRSSSAMPATPPTLVVPAKPQTGETVLVVEDQAEVRALVTMTLQRHGYVVLSAADGHEALAISARHLDDIHLLLTDVVMAGLSGRRLASEIHSTRPSIRVMYMSGYTDDAIVRHGVLEPGLVFLQKPFAIDMLLRRVREVLDSPAPPRV